MSRSTAVQGWEESNFPMTCEACLGNNPNVRMTMQNHGADCKICLKPFTIFRWSPGVGLKFRRTEICGTCAKLKNVCQSCILDLQYGLPVRVRDSVLGIKERVPVNEANREFFMASNAARLTRKDGSLVDYDKAAAEEPAAHSILAKLTDVRRPKTSNKIPAAIELSIEESDAIIGINDESGSIDRTVDSIDLEHQPNHESSEKRDKIKSRKNPIESTDEHPEINQNDGKVRRVEKNIRPTMRNHLAPPCSFFAKGLCTRADACPYRHVLIAPRVSSLKSYQNRYHGTADDPDAARIMQFAPNAANFAEKKAPADRTIKTLVIQGLSPNINIPEIVDHFARVQELTNSGTSHVESPSVKTNADRTAAFVSFSNRKTAEAVAQIAIGIVEIGGSSVYVSWSKKSEVDRPVK